MLYAFLITVREGLEAALIIGILLAYLRQAGRGRGTAQVWVGVAAALGLSLIGGLVLHSWAESLIGAGLDLFEGVAMLAAAGILTYMVLWMQRQAKHIKGKLQAQIDQALSGGSSLALGILAFTVIIREGIETVLFLTAGSIRAGSEYVIGGFLGALVAAIAGYLLYKGSLKLNLRLFFTASGIVLVMFAAGLLSNGIKELQEIGFLPLLIAHVWDSYHILRDNTPFGRLLGALLGYDASPSLMQVLSYFSYIIIVLTYLLRGITPPPPSAHHRRESISEV